MFFYAVFLLPAFPRKENQHVCIVKMNEIKYKILLALKNRERKFYESLDGSPFSAYFLPFYDW